jgi:hypothetical protein
VWLSNRENEKTIIRIGFVVVSGIRPLELDYVEPDSAKQAFDVLIKPANPST